MRQCRSCRRDRPSGRMVEPFRAYPGTVGFPGEHASHAGGRWFDPSRAHSHVSGHAVFAQPSCARDAIGAVRALNGPPIGSLVVVVNSVAGILSHRLGRSREFSRSARCARFRRGGRPKGCMRSSSHTEMRGAGSSGRRTRRSGLRCVLGRSSSRQSPRSAGRRKRAFLALVGDSHVLGRVALDPHVFAGPARLHRERAARGLLAGETVADRDPDGGRPQPRP